MTNVSIIGMGNMGEAISALVERGGHTVQKLTRQDASVPVKGDIVVLAVPYASLDSIVAERGEQLAGKTVVDITNPVNFETFDGLTVPADSSAAAELAAKLPNSNVLKAFNTNFGATLATGKVGDLTTSVLIAGDDQDAKAQLSDVVTASGANIIDAGSLKRAREMEGIGFLQITFAASEQIAWTSGFGIVK
ncbi:MAG: NAD(P)-binding domain-containing protein [Flaviflexus sp.]|uniref:NADPH-dependent F420 reductase n=1 Tax=Flaviflexus sp. TaxID=1969482 RepID=UPI00352F7320